MKFFRATYENGYCGCDDDIYIAAETLAEAENYANENMAEAYDSYWDWSQCIDEPEDFEVLKVLINNLGEDKYWKDYIDYLMEHKDLYALNSKFGYNEGYEKSIKNDSKFVK